MESDDTYDIVTIDDIDLGVEYQPPTGASGHITLTRIVIDDPRALAVHGPNLIPILDIEILAAIAHRLGYAGYYLT